MSSEETDEETAEFRRRWMDLISRCPHCGSHRLTHLMMSERAVRNGGGPAGKEDPVACNDCGRVSTVGKTAAAKP